MLLQSPHSVYVALQWTSVLVQDTGWRYSEKGFDFVMRLLTRVIVTTKPHNPKARIHFGLVVLG